MEINELIAKLKQYNQKDLAEYLLNTNSDFQKSILIQFENIDLDFYFQNIVTNLDSEEKELDIKPHPVVSQDSLNEEKCNLESIGESILKKGEVGFFVVAGGQGSRLGFEHPKGMYPVGPVSKRSLFQIHIEKIIAAGIKYDFEPHFFIMTSKLNHEETINYLEKNSYFGLHKNNVHIFPQGMLPAIDFDRNLILTQKDKVFFAPDGHGGSLKALKSNGMLELMKKKGIKYLSYFQVDNSLVNIADPLFLGQHVKKESQVSSKVIKKRDWKEKVGVPAYSNGKPSVVEYSDLPDNKAQEKDNNGELKYGYGSIAIHLFNLDFIDSITSDTMYLPFHIAKKKIKIYDSNTDSQIIPENANGIKFEQFIFDSIPMAQNAMFYETYREIEFAPLKNKEGNDSINTCHNLINNYFKNWLKKLNIDTKNIKNIEISSLFASNFNDFKQKMNTNLKEELGQKDNIYLDKE